MAHCGDVIEAGIYCGDIVRKKGHSAQSNAFLGLGDAGGTGVDTGLLGQGVEPTLGDLIGFHLEQTSCHG